MVERPHHDVLVLGGGNAGISLAARLLRDGCRDVAVVDPSTVHHYRPMLSYVGSGMAGLDELRRPQALVIPDGARWYTERAVAVDPRTSIVTLGDGSELTYGDLVVCPGSEVDWDAIPGSQDAVATPAASTNYLPALAPGTWAAMASLTRGTAVFTMSERHVPCPPVALNPLFTAVDQWRRDGTLAQIDVHLLVEEARLVPLARADAELRMTADDYGVHLHLRTTVESVDAHERVLHLRGPAGRSTLHYDALHLTPPHKAPSWIAQSGLAEPDTAGFVAVDPRTLQHVAYPRIWGLGDAAEVHAQPSGGALRKQVPVVAENIAARRRGGTMRAYDGYSVAPVTTSRRRLLLAEYDRDGRPEPTVSVPDLITPRWSTFVFDRYLEPLVYFHRLLKGKV